MIRRSQIPGVGSGLFARRHYAEGEVVARLQTPIRLSASRDVDSHLLKRGLPDDAVIWNRSSGGGWFAEAAMRRYPDRFKFAWFMMNCASLMRANTSCRCRAGNLVWVAVRQIYPGDHPLPSLGPGLA